jgi:hypothetical protein
MVALPEVCPEEVSAWAHALAPNANAPKTAADLTRIMTR